MKQELEFRILELTKIFPHPSKKQTNIPLFAGTSFEMGNKRLNFIIGPSGSGKTTLIKILMGIEPINAGEVIFEEHALQTLSNKERRDYLAKIGYMDQFPAKYLFLDLTVLQNLSYALALRRKMPRETRQKLIKATAEQFNLEPLLRKKTLFLSGGELRRLALLCSMIFAPKILLCDEPTAQLDKENKTAVMKTIKELREMNESLIVIATHDYEIITEGVVFEINDRRIRKW
ncbi:MAG: ATP-binding cassette domain-containing protein [Candidatus Heimdallarchaeota archaeon]|nr:ATP-binding cassette domain-containing protein [Candidatus Heimdallarchaeota archaeon]